MYSSRHVRPKGPPNIYYSRNYNYSYGQYPIQTPPPKFGQVNSSYSTQCKYHITPNVDFSEIKMNFNMLNEKLNNLKNIIDDDRMNIKYNKPNYHKEKCVYKEQLKRNKRFSREYINRSDYNDYYEYSDNYEDTNANNKCNRSYNMFLLKSNFNFEITTPNKKDEINEVSSDDNLSDIDKIRLAIYLLENKNFDVDFNIRNMVILLKQILMYRDYF